MKDYAALASKIIDAVGGKGNVSTVTHCMTRLRFILKDEGLADIEALEALDGVITVVRAGGQIQIVIGQSVDKVYDEVCRQGGFEALAAIDEDLDDMVREKQPWTPKRVLDAIMGALSGCILPILPVFIVAGIFKMLTVLLAPGYLGLLAEDSQLMTLFNLVGDAGYYFLPMFTAYSASKKFNCSPILALLTAGIMIHPSLLAIVEEGSPFSVYGIPMYEVNYTQAVIPVILVVWAQSYVERFFKRVLPEMLRTVGIPVLTIAVMLPVALCLFGPVCYVIMNAVASGILWLSDTVGIIAIVVVSMLWPIVIMFGMHVPILTALLPAQLEIGYDSIVYPAQMVLTFAEMAVFLAYAIRAKGSENKALGWECFATMTLANISEPGLYGILLRDRRAYAWMAVGGAAGALTCYLLGADVFIFSGVGFPFLNPLRFGPDIVQGIIGCAVAALVTFVLSMLFGFEGATGRPQFLKKKGAEPAAA